MKSVLIQDAIAKLNPARGFIEVIRRKVTAVTIARMPALPGRDDASVVTLLAISGQGPRIVSPRAKPFLLKRGKRGFFFRAKRSAL